MPLSDKKSVRESEAQVKTLLSESQTAERIESKSKQVEITEIPAAALMQAVQEAARHQRSETVLDNTKPNTAAKAVQAAKLAPAKEKPRPKEANITLPAPMVAKVAPKKVAVAKPVKLAASAEPKVRPNKPAVVPAFHREPKALPRQGVIAPKAVEIIRTPALHEILKPVITTLAVQAPGRVKILPSVQPNPGVPSIAPIHTEAPPLFNTTEGHVNAGTPISDNGSPAEMPIAEAFTAEIAFEGSQEIPGLPPELGYTDTGANQSVDEPTETANQLETLSEEGQYIAEYQEFAKVLGFEEPIVTTAEAAIEIQPLPPVCVEVSRAIQELAPEPAEVAKEMLQNIIGKTDVVIEQRMGGSELAVASEEELEQLCIELFEYLGIEYTPETVMDFVMGIIKTRKLGPETEAATPEQHDKGTHEIKSDDDQTPSRLARIFDFPIMRKLGNVILQLAA